MSYYYGTAVCSFSDTKDGDECDDAQFFVVNIDILTRRHGKYLLFYTYFKDKRITHV
jgi:hypothetical protein